MRYFITATDTGAGKTCVTCLLLRALNAAGRAAVAFKPVCCGSRQDVADPVLSTDPIEQHLTLRGTEPSREHLPVIGQHLRRDPIGPHRFRERVTHRPRRRSMHDMRRSGYIR